MEALIYIVEDDKIMATSIDWILQSVKYKSQIFTSSVEFLKNVNIKSHGCILLDMRMPDMSGIELQTKLNALGSNLPIIFMSAYIDSGLIIQVMKAGAIDFLTKPFDDQHLLESINLALNINREFHLKEIQNKAIKDKFEFLSLREMQVLQGIMNGYQNKIIAKQLKISLKTVEANRASMMNKLGVKSILQLAKLMLSKDIQEFLNNNKRWNFCIH